VYDDASTDTVDEGDVGYARMSANREILVKLPSDTVAADGQAYGKGILMQGDDGTDRRALLVGTDGHLQVDVLSGGTVGGGCLSVPVTLTVTNGAYTIADVAGGLITFANAVSANGKHAFVDSVVLAGVSAIPYELWFFNADIATPAADNAAFTLVAADTAKCLGVIPIATADYVAAQSAFNVATVRGAGLGPIKAGAATRSLYAYLKATATTTPGTTTLYLTVNFTYVD
jgi:hypothetical protein